MHMQIFGDLLGAKASTDDKLIEQHLETLAKWTVLTINYYVIKLTCDFL